MRIVVAGTGYVGLVTGACLSEIGHNVTCVDIDENKITMMKEGISPIYEPGLDELLKKNHDEGRLNFTTDYKNAYKNAEIVFIGVGTPEREDGSANLDYVFTVCKEIAENIENDCFVVVKSTVPIGTNDRVEAYLRENVINNVNIEVAFKQPIVVTNRRSAEMIKYASNDFLALKVSFINEMANVCEIVGANIEDVAKGMSYDKRIGDKFLKAGLGYGGSCFPKDTKALHWLANDSGYEIKTIKATIEVNENQKYKMFRKAKKRFGTLKGMKVAVLGLTFKPETDDLREAPSIPNINRLLEEGAKIVAYDPIGEENFKKIFKSGIEYVNCPEEALKNAEVVFIFTEWKEIKNLDLKLYENLMKTPIIFDGRNCYDIDLVEEYNIDYYSIGRSEILNINKEI